MAQRLDGAENSSRFQRGLETFTIGVLDSYFNDHTSKQLSEGLVDIFGGTYEQILTAINDLKEVQLFPTSLSDKEKKHFKTLAENFAKSAQAAGRGILSAGETEVLQSKLAVGFTNLVHIQMLLNQDEQAYKSINMTAADPALAFKSALEIVKKGPSTVLPYLERAATTLNEAAKEIDPLVIPISGVEAGSVIEMGGEYASSIYETMSHSIGDIYDLLPRGPHLRGSASDRMANISVGQGSSITKPFVYTPMQSWYGTMATGPLGPSVFSYNGHDVNFNTDVFYASQGTQSMLLPLGDVGYDFSRYAAGLPKPTSYKAPDNRRDLRPTNISSKKNIFPGAGNTRM